MYIYVYHLYIDLYNSQTSLQHVHNEAVRLACRHQVPGHASKVPGGAQQMILALLLQFLVGHFVNLHTQRQQSIVVAGMRLSIMVPFLQMWFFLCVKLGCAFSVWHAQSNSGEHRNNPCYLNVLWGVGLKLNQTQFQHIFMAVLAEHPLAQGEEEEGAAWMVNKSRKLQNRKKKEYSPFILLGIYT